MLRFLVYSLVAIFLITLVRAFIGIISRGFGELLSSGSSSQPGQSQPAGGELRKDPVCGVYVAESAAVKLSVKGETLYFCSPACRDKYLPPAQRG
jgi:YHS domain-containing protein